MNEFVDLLRQINIAQVFVILAGIWFFYNRLEKKIDKLETKMEKFEERLTRLENDMIEIKTILRLKECCMIKDDRQIKKAE